MAVETFHEARCRAAGITPAQLAEQGRLLSRILGVCVVVIAAMLMIIFG